MEKRYENVEYEYNCGGEEYSDEDEDIYEHDFYYSYQSKPKGKGRVPKTQFKKFKNQYQV